MKIIRETYNRMLYLQIQEERIKRGLPVNLVMTQLGMVFLESKDFIH